MTRDNITCDELTPVYKKNIGEYLNQRSDFHLVRDLQYEKEGDIVYFRYNCPDSHPVVNQIQRMEGNIPLKITETTIPTTLTDRQKAVLDLIKSGNQFLIRNLTEKAEIEALIISGYVTVEYKVVEKELKESKKPKPIFHKLPKTIEDYYAYSNRDIHTTEEKVNQITIYLTNGIHHVWQNSSNNGWIRVKICVV